MKREPKNLLSVDEIANRYPDQWVGLTNIVYDEDGVTIMAASVTYIGIPRDELFHRQLENGDVVAWYTTEDDFAMGIVGA